MVDKTEDFITKSQTIHGDNRYDYSKVKYINAKTNVVIICKKHGEFYQSPDSHLQKRGCKKCGIDNIKLKQRSNAPEFIKKAIDVHGDKYDYLNVDYVNNSTKIVIVCKIHGEFNQRPSDHLSGKACNKCGNNKIKLKNQSNTTKFIEKAVNVHGEKYDYSMVDYVNNSTEITIVCGTHGEFNQTPQNHLAGCGCKLCGKNKQILTQSSNTTEFIEKSISVHGNIYDYSRVVYINAKSKVIIICKEHGEFYQLPDVHLRNSGCLKCGIQKSTLSKTCSTTEFIKKSIDVHGDIYDYSKCNYIKRGDNVKLICKMHGEFEQKAADHLSGYGCKICGFVKISQTKTCSTEEFIKKSIDIYGDKFDYSLTEYDGCNNDITILCKLHGLFITKPIYHLKGLSCKKCNPRVNRYSKSAINYLNFIAKYNNILIQHAENIGEYIIKNTKYSADGYCENTNTIYEFHGDFWHGNPKLFKPANINSINGKPFGELYIKTLEREHLIQSLGYNLVVMWEYDWNKINKSIKKLQQMFRYGNSKLI